MVQTFPETALSRLRLYLSYISMLLSLSVPLCAKPACGWTLSLTQPDGTVLQAKLRGDEFVHVMTDLQGRTLVQNSDGFWCYALYSPDGSSHSSGYVAGRETPSHILSAASYIPYSAMSLSASEKRRTLIPYRREAALKTSAQARVKSGTVTVKTLILLAQYSDVKMKYTKEDFESLMNSGEGSARQYFEDQFLGSRGFSFEVGPVVTLSGKQADYGRNTGGPGTDAAPASAVAEACRLSHSAGVDFSEYDSDGDGTVDNVFLFVAGKDEAEGGGDDCIWSHAWYLTAAGIDLNLDGKKIDSYAVSSELGLRRSGSYLFTTIGTFCHEFSHTLGLMDMYDTDSETNGTSDCLWKTTGLMDNGNYNNDGKTPPYYNAIDRDMLGIGNPETLREGRYRLEPVNENGRFLRCETGREGEYYLIECRSGKGWDKYAGGSGLAIYHIDKSDNSAGYSAVYEADVTAGQRWVSNEVNCVSSHQCADMVEAYPKASSAAQVFFPYDRCNAFTYLTDPPFKSWDGTASTLAITGITVSGDDVLFNVTRAGDYIPDKAVVTGQEIFQDAAIIRWETEDSLTVAAATVSWGQSGKTAQELEIQAYDSGKYSVTLENLSPSTAYSVRIYYEAGGIKGQETTVNFTTKSLYRDGWPYIYLNNVSRNSDGSFPYGAELPLRVFNLSGTCSVEWYMDGRSISTDGSGYYAVTRSCRLKAVITYEDGTGDIIVKDIKVK